MVGIVIGLVVTLGLVVAALYFLRKRGAQTRDVGNNPDVEEEQKMDVNN